MDVPKLPRLIIESMDNGYVISVWERQVFQVSPGPPASWAVTSVGRCLCLSGRMSRARFAT